MRGYRFDVSIFAVSQGTEILSIIPQFLRITILIGSENIHKPGFIDVR
jgi:hypothetical protein